MRCETRSQGVGQFQHHQQGQKKTPDCGGREQCDDSIWINDWREAGEEGDDTQVGGERNVVAVYRGGFVK